jgi:hypothetical protein
MYNHEGELVAGVEPTWANAHGYYQPGHTGRSGYYAADAGNRSIVIYSREGEQLGEFEGKAESEDGHGFIIPSANFDLAVNSFGELWIVNPAKHSIENYSDDGRLRGFWQNSLPWHRRIPGLLQPGQDYRDGRWLFCNQRKRTGANQDP